jgi:hypothetical protein
MGDGGRWISAVFGLIGILVLVAGLGITAARVQLARRRAAEAGQNPTTAMLRALSGEDDPPDHDTDR